MSTLDARRLDQWLTREPDWDEPPLPGDDGWPRCEDCGGFLRMTPDRTIVGEDGIFCDGIIREHYERFSPESERIIGQEGVYYKIEYTQCSPGYDELVFAHAEHFEIMDTYTMLYRTCRKCGHVNKEMVV